MGEKTILDFTEITDVDDDDVLYLVRGTGAGADKKESRSNFLQSIKTDTIIEKTTDNGVDIEGVHLENSIIEVDTINEKTTDNGVDIETINLKEGVLTVSGTTESTTKDTGSLITEGGIGAEKNICNGGYLKSGMGRWPTGYIHGDNVTHETIFDTLVVFLPNINDLIIISGGTRHGGQDYSFSYAKRKDATRITLYGYNITNTVSGSFDVNENDNITDEDISMVW